MNDELLMKFIDGTATQEEAEAVIEYLSKDGKATDEWMQIVQGARLSDVDPPLKIDGSDVCDHVSKVLDINRGKTVKFIPWIIGTVTSVAASAAIIFMVFSRSESQNTEDNLYAGIQGDTALVITPKSEIVPETPQPKESEQLLYEAKPSVIPQMIHDSNASEKGLNSIHSFEMVKPVKSPYRIRVKNLDGSFTFDWSAEGVATTLITITDREGNVVFERLMDNEDGTECSVKVSELTDKGLLKWKIEATYENGDKQNHTGEMEFTYMP